MTVTGAQGLHILVNKLSHQAKTAEKYGPINDRGEIVDGFMIKSDNPPYNEVTGEKMYEDPQYPLYDKLKGKIEKDFGIRGEQIVNMLHEAVINFEEHRNGNELQNPAVRYVKNYEIQLWSWRTEDWLCFTLNSTAPYKPIDYSQISLTLEEKKQKTPNKVRGNGHMLMAHFGDLLIYDETGSMYLFFKLPEEYHLTSRSL